MKWLHLSDIHFQNVELKDNTTILRKELLDFLDDIKDLDFIIITGDLFYKYRMTEGLNEFICKLSSHVRNNKIYICPGNHDINRCDPDRKELIDNEVNFFDSSIINSFDGYEKFNCIYNKFTNKNYDKHYWIDDSEEKYRIISLDSCMNYINDERKCKIFHKKLYELESIIKNDEKLNIVITHYGIDMLDKDDSIRFQHWADKHNIDMICCGHNHRPSIRTYDETINGIKQFTCGTMKVDEFSIPSFFIHEFNKEKWEVHSRLYAYSEFTHDWNLSAHTSRPFVDGKYIYKIPRKYQSLLNSEYKSMFYLSFDTMKQYLNNNYMTLVYEIVNMDEILAKTKDFNIDYIDYDYTVQNNSLISTKKYRGSYNGNNVSNILFPIIMASNTGNTSEEISVNAYNIMDEKREEIKYDKKELGTYIWCYISLPIDEIEFFIEVNYKWPNSFSQISDYVLVSPNYLNRDFNNFDFKLKFDKKTVDMSPVVHEFKISKNGKDNLIGKIRAEDDSKFWIYRKEEIKMTDICFYVYTFTYK